MQLVRTQQAYQRDLSAITGQDNQPVYLNFSQQQTLSVAAIYSNVTQAQWQARLHSPNAIICAGPKYQYA